MNDCRYIHTGEMAECPISIELSRFEPHGHSHFALSTGTVPSNSVLRYLELFVAMVRRATYRKLF